jgi:hypothetical protein
MNRRIVLAFSVSVVMSATIGFAGLSRALPSDVRASGFACAVTDGRNAGSFVRAGNNSTTSSLSLACPIPDVYNGVQGISTVQVAIFDQSTAASASASLCVNLFSSVGTSCGTVATVPASLTGFYTVNPPTFADWTAPNLGYAAVTLPARISGSLATTVQGIHAF